MKNFIFLLALLYFPLSINALEVCFDEHHFIKKDPVFFSSSNCDQGFLCDAVASPGRYSHVGYIDYGPSDLVKSSNWGINTSEFTILRRESIREDEYEEWDYSEYPKNARIPIKSTVDKVACINAESYLIDGRNDFNYKNDLFNEKSNNITNNILCEGIAPGAKCETIGVYVFSARVEIENEGKFLLCLLDIEESDNHFSSPFPIGDECSTYVDINLIDEVELLEGITQFESTIADLISSFDSDIPASQALIDKALEVNNMIFDLDFSSLSASDLSSIKEAQDFFNDLKGKATDVQKEIDAIAAEIERKIDDTAIDVDTRLVERGFTPAGIQFESTLPDYSLDIPSTSTSDRFAESGSFYEDYADDSIKTLARYYNAGDNRQFLIEVRAWLNNSETLKRNLSAASFDSPAEWRKFSDAFKRVNDYIYSIVDSELWFKDSPVTPYIRESFNDLAKDFPIQAQVIEDEMRTWRGQVVTEQQLAFIRAFEGIARGFRVMGSELALIGKTATDMMNSAAASVKSGVTCATKVVALADMGDMIELTSGKDICTGEELTATGRFLTGIGLGIGYGKFWRAVGETLGLNVKVKASIEKIGANANILTARASKEAAILISSKTDSELGKLVALSRADVDGLDVGRSFTNLPGRVRNFPGVKNNKNGTFNIVDREAFINQVDFLFDSDGNPLNQVIKDRILQFIGDDKSRIFPVKGRGLPGLHAEVQAVNAALNRAPVGTLPQNINVATIVLLPGDNQGLPFPACNNCGGILQGFSILTGVK